MSQLRRSPCLTAPLAATAACSSAIVLPVRDWMFFSCVIVAAVVSTISSPAWRCASMQSWPARTRRGRTHCARNASRRKTLFTP